MSNVTEKIHIKLTLTNKIYNDMTDKEIRQQYQLIKEFHSKYLDRHGVQLPKLERGGMFTKDALVLVYLSKNYPDTTAVTKDELTRFIRTHYPDINDVQQARHLAAQKGWYILSGTRKDNESKDLKDGEYKLKTLKEHYPGFTHERREYSAGEDYFEELKKQYDYRCATCGSKEGEPHRYWKNTKTVLQKGHMDPYKALEPGNIIPQCEKCNRPDRNYWIYDKRGRVIGIANEKVMDKCSKSLKIKIFKRLQKELESD